MNLADAQVAAEAGADALGFVFYEKSPRFISMKTAAEISRALPPFIIRVGVFVDPSEELVLKTVAECGLTLLQFHGDEPPEFCAQFGLMSMKAFRIHGIESLKGVELDARLLVSFACKIASAISFSEISMLIISLMRPSSSGILMPSFAKS